MPDCSAGAALPRCRIAEAQHARVGRQLPSWWIASARELDSFPLDTDRDGVVEWTKEAGFYPGQRLVLPFSYATNGLPFANLFAYYQVMPEGLIRRAGSMDACIATSPVFETLEEVKLPMEGCPPLSDRWADLLPEIPDFLSGSSPLCSNPDPEGYCVVALDCDLDLETCINNRCTPK